MKIEAKQRLVLADWKSEVKQTITDKKLLSAIDKIASVVKVSHVGLDGYNDDGAQGCEIHFTGKENSFVAYGAPVLSARTMSALSSAMETIDVAEMMAGEDQELVIILAVAS